MSRLTFLLILLFQLTIVQAQIEVPTGGTDCKIQQNNKVSYCVNTDSYNIMWMAMQIKANDIKNKSYLPPDSEIFKDMPKNTMDIWSKIEAQSKMWAVEFDSIYVVSGIHTNDSTKAYYKAILKGCQGDGLAFYIRQGQKVSDITQCAVTIKHLEEITSLNFWPTLNADLQEIFEAEFNWDFWPITE